jgi:magnesium chelatase family protein
MNKNEILETTKIFSISGLLNNETPLITKRPFREIHHTASLASIIGGGTYPKPGEISLAHNGVLFVDEIAEFPRVILESLRQPLEDRFINITRINSTIKFPSNFTLLATMNPCPCGYKNDRRISCFCTEFQIRNYQKKLSGPILDRFDLFLEVAKMPMDKIFTLEIENQKQLKNLKTIKNAIKAQKQRFKNSRTIHKNSDMDIKAIKKFCMLNKDTRALLNQASRKLNLSNRGYLKTIKLARTIADMEQNEKIQENHIAEAIQYRSRKVKE